MLLTDWLTENNNNNNINGKSNKNKYIIRFFQQLYYCITQIIMFLSDLGILYQLWYQITFPIGLKVKWFVVKEKDLNKA